MLTRPTPLSPKETPAGRQAVIQRTQNRGQQYSRYDSSSLTKTFYHHHNMAPPSVAEILKDSEFIPELVERISVRKTKQPVELVPPNPAWAERFLSLKERIVSTLGNQAVAVNHVGSTSVPDLPAKDVIDIDLVVADITNEDSYVAQLESQGFHFLLREPHWHQHRFFYAEEPYFVNLHVWGLDCPEVERHRIFRDWLRRCPEDKAAYREAKELSSQQTQATGGDTQDYNWGKEAVIRRILRNAFRDLGYLDATGEGV
jgi:GrpB-like predicted nucleotidyltransferase (UPF0157 family)